MSVNHGMLLSVLSRPTGGCRAAKDIIRECHEPEASKRRLRRRGTELFRSLVEANIVQLRPGGVDINSDLQHDFSLNQALSLYAVEALDSLDESASDFSLVLLSVVESILESPHAVLGKQVATLKTKLVAELKAAGVEYDERMKRLDEVNYPKPEAEFIYDSFNLFEKNHPWVSGHNIAPKSIVREMFEGGYSFNEYVKEYGLARAEGVLLRYITDAYRALNQTVPDKHKTEDVFDIIEWLGAELRSTDASLIEEWEALTDPEGPKRLESEEPLPPPDITTNRRAFTIVARNAAWRVTQAFARRDYERAERLLLELDVDGVQVAKDHNGEPWHKKRLEAAFGPYFEEYEAIVIDANARSPKRAVIDDTNVERWSLRQTLSDPEDNLDWALDFEVELPQSREHNRVVLRLLTLGPSR
jgi:biotin operon repressor